MEQEFLRIKSVRTFKAVVFRDKCIPIPLLKQQFKEKNLNYTLLVCSDTLDIIEPTNQDFYLEFGHTYVIPSGTNDNNLTLPEKDTLSSLHKSQSEYKIVNEELQKEYSEFLKTQTPPRAVTRNLPVPKKNTGKVIVVPPTPMKITLDSPGYKVEDESNDDPNGLWASWKDYREFSRCANANRINCIL